MPNRRPESARHDAERDAPASVGHRMTRPNKSFPADGAKRRAAAESQRSE